MCANTFVVKRTKQRVLSVSVDWSTKPVEEQHQTCSATSTENIRFRYKRSDPSGGEPVAKPEGETSAAGSSKQVCFCRTCSFAREEIRPVAAGKDEDLCSRAANNRYAEGRPTNLADDKRITFPKPGSTCRKVPGHCCHIHCIRKGFSLARLVADKRRCGPTPTMMNALIFLHMNSFLLFNIGEEPCRELRPLVLLPPDANEDPDYQSDLPDLEHAMLS